MILLEYGNRIIEQTLVDKFGQEEFESVEAVIADFDSVTFHLSTDPNAKNMLYISMSIKCYSELKKCGVDQIMQGKYGKYVTQPEQGYDFTICIDLAQKPGDVNAFAKDIALMKRHALSAPFQKVFTDIEAKKPGQLIEVAYRDDEAFFLKPETDRCIVVFAIQFKDPDDAVFAKVFLQEYQDARKTMTNVPSVTYSQKEPPMELKGARNVKPAKNQGYVSFVLFQPQMAPGKREKTIDNIETFRNYLHYHIKCSKAYLHTRMRNKVRSFLQVLNRSRMEGTETKEKKTFAGKTFKRADDPQNGGFDESMNI